MTTAKMMTMMMTMTTTAKIMSMIKTAKMMTMTSETARNSGEVEKGNVIE